MPVEVQKDLVASVIGEVVGMEIGAVMTMIERQEIGDQVHHPHRGKKVSERNMYFYIYLTIRWLSKSL